MLNTVCTSSTLAGIVLINWPSEVHQIIRGRLVCLTVCQQRSSQPGQVLHYLMVHLEKSQKAQQLLCFGGAGEGQVGLLRKSWLLPGQGLSPARSGWLHLQFGSDKRLISKSKILCDFQLEPGWWLHLEPCSCKQLLVERIETCQENGEWRKCFLSVFCFVNVSPCLPWKALILPCAQSQRYVWLSAPVLCKIPEWEGQIQKKNSIMLYIRARNREGRIRLWMPPVCSSSLIQSSGSAQHLTGSISMERCDATGSTSPAALTPALKVCMDKKMWLCSFLGCSDRTVEEHLERDPWNTPVLLQSRTASKIRSPWSSRSQTLWGCSMPSLSDLFQGCATLKIFHIKKREDTGEKYWYTEGL